MKFPRISHVVGLCVLLAACAGAKMEQISRPGDLSLDHANVRIDAPDKVAFTIADARLRPQVVSLTLPFQLAEVPKAAKLEMIVSPLETACPLARQPQASTRISLNNLPVTEFTLGPDRLGRPSLGAPEQGGRRARVRPWQADRAVRLPAPRAPEHLGRATAPSRRPGQPGGGRAGRREEPGRLTAAPAAPNGASGASE